MVRTSIIFMGWRLFPGRMHSAQALPFGADDRLYSNTIYYYNAFLSQQKTD
jgi:hypothetical protein